MSHAFWGHIGPWLSGKPTGKPAWDHARKVAGRIAILAMIWAAMCVWLGHSKSTDRERTYGLQTVQAIVFQQAGFPLPQEIIIKSPDGTRRKYACAEVANLGWIQPYIQVYFHNQRIAALIWLWGIISGLYLAYSIGSTRTYRKARSWFARARRWLDGKAALVPSMGSGAVENLGPTCAIDLAESDEKPDENLAQTGAGRSAVDGRILGDPDRRLDANQAPSMRKEAGPGPSAYERHYAQVQRSIEAGIPLNGPSLLSKKPRPPRPRPDVSGGHDPGKRAGEEPVIYDPAELFLPPEINGQTGKDGDQ